MTFSINDFNSLFQHTIAKIKKTQYSQTVSEKIKTTPVKDSFEKAKEIKIFDIIHFTPKEKTAQKIQVEQNPIDKGTIYKKITNKETGQKEKVPYEVEIAKSQKDNTVTYHIVDPKTKEEIGFVSIDDWTKAKSNPKYAFWVENSRLLDDFSEIGITGDRISIDFLQNNNDKQFSGIGKLADQIAIEYCLKEGIPTNIVSVAKENSHVAHYKRGRRFIELDKNDPDIDYYEFKRQFGTTDPNKIIEERIAKAQGNGKIDTSDLFGLYMYMPQEIVNKYLERIKEHPILH